MLAGDKQGYAANDFPGIRQLGDARRLGWWMARVDLDAFSAL